NAGRVADVSARPLHLGKLPDAVKTESLACPAGVRDRNNRARSGNRIDGGAPGRESCVVSVFDPVELAGLGTETDDDVNTGESDAGNDQLIKCGDIIRARGRAGAKWTRDT